MFGEETKEIKLKTPAKLQVDKIFYLYFSISLLIEIGSRGFENIRRFNKRNRQHR